MAIEIEQLYEQHIKSLPTAERLRLIEKIVSDLATQAAPDKPAERYDWMSVRGIAPNLLGGEDAQAWVSRTRREGDEQREKQWKREL
jgi:hypothetical protein